MRFPASHCLRLGLHLGLRLSLTLLFAAITSLPAFSAPGDVQVSLNDASLFVGTRAFPFEAGKGLVLDNGLIRFTFNRDDAAGGIVTGWDGSSNNRSASTSITATSIVVNGTELAHNLNGVSPRDPDRQHTFYIDAGGGSSRLICSEVRLLRATPDLAEVAFVDTSSAPLRHEHHLIMRRGKRGLYGYNILTIVGGASMSEVRMNTRWDRAIFDHSFNWERGSGRQPTYGYLATQRSVGDETWRLDANNDAVLPADSIYTKYSWSLYHHENPMFGHYGHGFGAWFTALGGVTDQTLSSFYGAGPNHHDLAIHQDALILNYFGRGHYGQPGYRLSDGYRRLYGPWFTYITTGDPAQPEAMIAQAAAVAKAEIAENRAGSAWLSDGLYPKPGARTLVTGRLKIADGRPASGLWVLLSTQDSSDVYTIHEPTYFVKTDANGNFALPGIPPAMVPGTSAPGTYNLYVFAAQGSITEQYKQTGLSIGGATQNLGTINWAPTSRTTFLWQIGKADRNSGEFALATNPADFSSPRSYEKPSLVPETLDFTIGRSWEPTDWAYAQTKPGTWTISFDLDRLHTGTAYLTVATSMQQGGTPMLAINGSSADIVGTLPSGSGSVISRQADRSGFPRTSEVSFPASRLKIGTNTVTLTREGGGGASGLGWDTLVLQVDETTAPAPAQLSAKLTAKSKTATANIWTLTVANTGRGSANHMLLDGFAVRQTSGTSGPLPTIISRNPSRFSVPLGSIAAGQSAQTDISLDMSKVPAGANHSVKVSFSANGGKATGSLDVPLK